MYDLILKFTGQTFTTYEHPLSLSDGNLIIDWDDGTTETDDGTNILTHTYSESGTYLIRLSSEYQFDTYGDAFRGITGLTSAVISEGVELINSRSFLGCTGLKTVIIPSTVTEIGNRVFEGCTNLEAVVFLPSIAPTVGDRLFENVPTTCKICTPNAQSTSVYSSASDYPNPNTYYYTLNNILSLNGSLSELGHLMANNLSNMGISNAHGSDGLTSLANQILNIEPSVSGLNLETSLTVQSEAEIEVGESVVISSKLNVFYDDETLVNVDLSGVLTGATINIKEGNNIVGTGITNSNGIADISVSNLSVGTHTLKAVFSGTENFQECESDTISINVVTLKPTNIEINATKNILSYVDTDSTDITVTLLNKSDVPVSGQTVTMGVYMVNGDSLIETLSVVDENDGTYTSTYSSQGVGDIYVKAVCGSLVTETYALCDADKYDATEHSKTTLDTTSTSWNIFNGYSFTLTDFEVSFDGKFQEGGGFSLENPSDRSKYISCALGTGKFSYYTGIGGVTDTTREDTGDTNYHSYKIVKQGNTISYYRDGNLKKTVSSVSYSGSLGVYFRTWNDRTFYAKNILIKPLQSINIDVDHPILSYADSTQANPQIATLTATVQPVMSGRTVQIYKDDVLVATEQTDGQGQVSYEYESQGVGDVEFEFKYGSLTKTYSIQDCVLYDDCSSNKTSSYSGTLSLGYNSNGYCYIPSNASTETYAMRSLANSIAEPIKLSFDTQTTSNYNSQIVVGLIDSSSSTGKGVRVAREQGKFNLQKLKTLTTMDNLSVNNVSYDGNWYHVEVDLTNTDITAKLYNSSSTLVGTYTTTLEESKTYDELYVRVTKNANAQINFKNIKIKPL